MRSIIEARVVVLPLPVVPVTRTSPRCMAQIFSRTGGQDQILDGLDLEGDDPEGDGDRAPLVEDAPPEPAESRQAVGQVDVEILLELPPLDFAHHLGGQGFGVLGRSAAGSFQGDVSRPVNPELGMVRRP